LAVFWCHCLVLWFPSKSYAWGHNAVLVFFVLSGYVIAYAIRSKPLSMENYVIDRLSRLYSVVLPALILTAFLSWVGSNYFSHTVYGPYTRPLEWLRLIMSGLFLNQIWVLSVSPLTNQPFWSLGYEFWYYVFYGVLIFTESRRQRALLITVIVAVTGFNIWLLAIIWFFGVFALYLSDRIILARHWATVGLVLSTLALIAALRLVPDFPNPNNISNFPFFWSGIFIKDWVVGLFIAAIIFTFDKSFLLSSFFRFCEIPIRWLAAHTFSLYLYHFPLLLFITATRIFNPNILWSLCLETISTLALVVLLSTFTESKRYLFRQAIRYAWQQSRILLSVGSRRSILKLASSKHSEEVNE
jgi:peptidoglycan/LPS O-acetylase OafA/YrhL